VFVRVCICVKHVLSTYMCVCASDTNMYGQYMYVYVRMYVCLYVCAVCVCVCMYDEGSIECIRELEELLCKKKTE